MKPDETTPEKLMPFLKRIKNALMNICHLDEFYLLYRQLHTNFQFFYYVFLESLSTKKYTVKDSFNFSIEKFDQYYCGSRGSLGKDWSIN